MYKGFSFAVRSPANSVTSRALLRFSQLVHLGHALLELFVLAFLVAVSLVLLGGERNC